MIAKINTPREMDEKVEAPTVAMLPFDTAPNYLEQVAMLTANLRCFMMGRSILRPRKILMLATRGGVWGS